MSVNAEIGQLRKRLDTERAKLMNAVSEFASDDLTQPHNGGWSVKDILAHVVVAESVNVTYAKLMLSQERPAQLAQLADYFPDYVRDHPMTQPFSLDEFNAFITDQWRARSLSQVLDALVRTRAETLAWMETLTSEQLDRGGQHAVWGDQTVRGMLKILLIHDKMHTQDILKRKSSAG